MFNIEVAGSRPAKKVPGLRERKKQKTRTAILQAAQTLMEQRGYDATTMEEVAEAAEVSVGSLYNYFASKQALLLGVVSHASGDLLASGRAILEAPSEDARAAILGVLKAYTMALLDLDRALLRRALGISFTEPPEMSAELVRLDLALIAQLDELVVAFQRRGEITDEITAEQAAVSLYGTFCISVLFWLGLPDGDPKVLDAMLEQQLSVVFRGLEPRRKKGGRK